MQMVLMEELDIDVETLTRREKFIIKRLREYRTIDADIKVQERLMRGIGLLNEPRITAAPLSKQDYMRYLCRVGVKLTDDEKEIVDAMKRYINPLDFVTYFDRTKRVRFNYATAARVANKLKTTFADDKGDDERLQAAFEILSQEPDETFLHLTDTEQVVDRRLSEREEAEERYNILVERKEIIQQALALMQQYEHEGYIILWHRYVMDEHWIKVRELAARNGVPLSEREYRNARGKALTKFGKWAHGLN